MLELLSLVLVFFFFSFFFFLPDFFSFLFHFSMFYFPKILCSLFPAPFYRAVPGGCGGAAPSSDDMASERASAPKMEGMLEQSLAEADSVD